MSDNTEGEIDIPQKSRERYKDLARCMLDVANLHESRINVCRGSEGADYVDIRVVPSEGQGDPIW